jgi:23S rRNA (adenine2503-C2)-methyltransferase
LSTNLFGLTLGQLRAFAADLGRPAYLGNQLAQWIYKRRVSSFEVMSDLSVPVRKELQELCSLERQTPTRVDESQDGTKKYLFPVNGKFIETAYIPESDRKTLCVSSQVGCKMGCLFCMTGKQGFQANLTSAQILNQVVSIAEFAQLTNVVYMGMGEPLDNLEPVLSSLEVLTADWGLGFSQQKVTLSSVGLLPALEEFFSRSRVRFALSLHSPFDDERASLMPVQNVHALDEVLDFLRNRQESDVRRISIEYICFSGVNDTPRHTKELVRRLHGLKTRVNLIHFHPIPGTPLQGSDSSAMERMQKELQAKGIAATIRRSRGEDIWAACGLLSTKALTSSTKT